MHQYTLAVLLALLTLGSIGNDRRPLSQPPTPPLTDEAVGALYYDILERGNTAIPSSVVSYERGADEFYEFQPAKVCQGPECTEDFTLEDLQLEFLGSRRGIHLSHEFVRRDDVPGFTAAGWKTASSRSSRESF